jgi:hypothetical protein
VLDVAMTMDRPGHLMEGLDNQTADGLDGLADAWSGPGAWREYEKRSDSPLTSGKNWQSRPDSNRRFRLERPGQDPPETYGDQAKQGENER